MSWPLWAHQYDTGVLFHIGPRPYVELHGLPDPVVAVTVTEVPADSPDITHWGWLWTEGSKNWCDGAPCMIQPHQGLYSMQFPYGPTAEERAGRGRTVCLQVTLREES
jgi:hypothetical protein